MVSHFFRFGPDSKKNEKNRKNRKKSIFHSSMGWVWASDFCGFDKSFAKMVELVLMNHHQVGSAVLVLRSTLAPHVAVSSMIVTNRNVKMVIALME